MSIKNVVKVMNFHSLLRVDRSKKQSVKYSAMEQTLIEMIDNIVNNRNIILDYKTLRVKEDKPVLNIYIGSDMGFCNNLNSLVNRYKEECGENDCKIIIGRKIRGNSREKVLLYQSREEYDKDNSRVMELLAEGIRQLKYSKINIVYNHYYNSTTVQIMNKQVFPLEKAQNTEAGAYREDFTIEGDIDRLLIDLMVLYVQYSMEIAAAVSYAAENISRQNVTTESLRRIDERDAEFKIRERKDMKAKEFAKVLDNYTKNREY